MAETTETTTIKELDPLGAITDEFNMLAENPAGTNDYKVPASVIKAYIDAYIKATYPTLSKDDTPREVDGSSAAGLVSNSALNSALTNLSEIKIETKTDANECIPSANLKKQTYEVLGGGSNLPTTDTSAYCFIEVERGATSSGTPFLIQNCVNYSTKKTYQRTAVYNGTTWNFGTWYANATETDLANYSKVQTSLSTSVSSGATRTIDISSLPIGQYLVMSNLVNGGFKSFGILTVTSYNKIFTALSENGLTTTKTDDTLVITNGTTYSQVMYSTITKLSNFA